MVLKERKHECTPTDKNMYILFHEQAVCRRGPKMEKSLLDEGK